MVRGQFAVRVVFGFADPAALVADLDNAPDRIAFDIEQGHELFFRFGAISSDRLRQSGSIVFKSGQCSAGSVALYEPVEVVVAQGRSVAVAVAALVTRPKALTLSETDFPAADALIKSQLLL